ncbi:ImmA/IrrE family metallo-endopeptidase [Comamonas sp. GB3 AK4-5]|uniref:ImmA/IrrE family metallo-endopeptidase n=1 Tax=Comamonas sp. GB3 AK4-5 TaxID=3231487 RepID=UPI00351F2E6E
MALLAEGILKTHWDQSVPVNLARIAKAMQLRVSLGDTGTACALLEVSGAHKACVTIGQSHPITRQRYGVAHAIAHLALHHLRPGMQRAICISDSYHADHNQRQDSEANDFALQLLLPETVLRYTVAGRHACSLQELAHLFEVPEILVKQRLADLDLALPKTLAQQLDPRVAEN